MFIDYIVNNHRFGSFPFDFATSFLHPIQNLLANFGCLVILMHLMICLWKNSNHFVLATYSTIVFTNLLKLLNFILTSITNQIWITKFLCLIYHFLANLIILWSHFECNKWLKKDTVNFWLNSMAVFYQSSRIYFV